MAYADASPAAIEGRLRRVPKTVPKTVLKTKRTTRCPTQAEIWPQHRFRGLVRKRRTLKATLEASRRVAGGILLKAARAAGAAIGGGLLEERRKVRKLTRAETLLLHIDADTAVRRVVGRVDVSGGSNAACWAATRTDPAGVTHLDVFYRHGRDVLVDLARVVDALVRARGWKVARTLDRIRRAPKMESGVWVAAWALSPG
jgi:hypothetical protein